MNTSKTFIEDLTEKIDEFFSRSPEEIEAFLKKCEFDEYNKVGREIIAPNTIIPPQEYFSFMICSRADSVGFYRNGLSLGELNVNDGKFTPSKINYGNSQDLTPFKTTDEFKTYLKQCIDKIQFEDSDSDSGNKQ